MPASPHDSDILSLYLALIERNTKVQTLEGRLLARTLPFCLLKSAFSLSCALSACDTRSFTNPGNQDAVYRRRKGGNNALNVYFVRIRVLREGTLCERGSRDKTRNVKKHPTVFTLRYKGNNIHCSLPFFHHPPVPSLIHAQRSSLFHRPR